MHKSVARGDYLGNITFQGKMFTLSWDGDIGPDIHNYYDEDISKKEKWDNLRIYFVKHFNKINECMEEFKNNKFFLPQTLKSNIQNLIYDYDKYSYNPNIVEKEMRNKLYLFLKNVDKKIKWEILSHKINAIFQNIISKIISIMMKN